MMFVRLDSQLALELQRTLLEQQHAMLERQRTLQEQQQMQLDLILSAVGGASLRICPAHTDMAHSPASQRRAAVSAAITALATPQAVLDSKFPLEDGEEQNWSPYAPTAPPAPAEIETRDLS